MLGSSFSLWESLIRWFVGKVWAPQNLLKGRASHELNTWSNSLLLLLTSLKFPFHCHPAFAEKFISHSFCCCQKVSLQHAHHCFIVGYFQHLLGRESTSFSEDVGSNVISQPPQAHLSSSPHTFSSTQHAQIMARVSLTSQLRAPLATLIFFAKTANKVLDPSAAFYEILSSSRD